jgi:biopolymer transport protein ExbD
MRLSRKRRNTRMQMDMTPMIDIAFQLIIFFMTVSQMTQANQERLQLPKQKGTEEQRPRTLVINVTDEGALRVSGESITLAGMISRVNDELVRLGDDPERLHVVIRADERGASRGVNELVTALGKLRITRIRIAVETGG